MLQLLKLIFLKSPIAMYVAILCLAVWINFQHLYDNAWNWPAPFMSEEQLIEYDEWLLKQKAMERQRDIDAVTREAQKIIQENRKLTKEQIDALEPRIDNLSKEKQEEAKMLEKMLEEAMKEVNKDSNN